MNNQWQSNAFGPERGNLPPRSPRFQGGQTYEAAPPQQAQIPEWQRLGYQSALDMHRQTQGHPVYGPGGPDPSSFGQGGGQGPRQGGGRAMPGMNQVQGVQQPQMPNQTDGGPGGPQFRPYLGTYGANPGMGYSRYGYNTPGYGAPNFGRNYGGPGSEFRSPGNTSGYYQDPRRMSGNYQANNPNMMGEITRQMFGG